MYKKEHLELKNEIPTVKKKSSDGLNCRLDTTDKQKSVKLKT